MMGDKNVRKGQIIKDFVGQGKDSEIYAECSGWQPLKGAEWNDQSMSHLLILIQ